MIPPFLILLLTVLPGAPQQKPTHKPDIEVLDPSPPKADPENAPVEYAVNPHQAKKEMEVGEYYVKKGNHAAAATRFQEAVKWQPKLARAYLRLGEACEKTGELQKALEAFQKYLEIEPTGKKARDAKKAVARLERELKK